MTGATGATVNMDIGAPTARPTIATTDRNADAEATVDRLADDGFPDADDALRRLAERPTVPYAAN